MLATAGYVEQRDERAAKRAALGLEQLLQTSTGSTMWIPHPYPLDPHPLKKHVLKEIQIYSTSSSKTSSSMWKSEDNNPLYEDVTKIWLIYFSWRPAFQLLPNQSYQAAAKHRLAVNIIV